MGLYFDHSFTSFLNLYPPIRPSNRVPGPKVLVVVINPPPQGVQEEQHIERNEFELLPKITSLELISAQITTAVNHSPQGGGKRNVGKVSCESHESRTSERVEWRM
jgi:hypothetical protein